MPAIQRHDFAPDLFTTVHIYNAAVIHRQVNGERFWQQMIGTVTLFSHHREHFARIIQCGLGVDTATQQR